MYVPVLWGSCGGMIFETELVGRTYESTDSGKRGDTWIHMVLLGPDVRRYDCLCIACLFHQNDRFVSGTTVPPSVSMPHGEDEPSSRRGLIARLESPRSSPKVWAKYCDSETGLSLMV